VPAYRGDIGGLEIQRSSVIVQSDPNHGRSDVNHYQGGRVSSASGEKAASRARLKDLTCGVHLILCVETSFGRSVAIKEKKLFWREGFHRQNIKSLGRKKGGKEKSEDTRGRGKTQVAQIG